MERKVTRLDLFSRIENGVYQVWFFFALFGTPFIAFFLAEIFLPETINPIGRFLLVLICAFIAPFLSLIFGTQIISDFFEFIRHFFHMRPLMEIELEIADARREEEIGQEKKRKEWFLSRQEDEQRYLIWERLEKMEKTGLEIEKLRLRAIWIFALGGLAVWLIFRR